MKLTAFMSADGVNRTEMKSQSLEEPSVCKVRRTTGRRRKPCRRREDLPAEA